VPITQPSQKPEQTKPCHLSEQPDRALRWGTMTHLQVAVVPTMSTPTEYTIGHVADLLRSGDAFEGMPREQALAVANRMSMQSYKAGESIVRQGEESQGRLVLVVAGLVKVSSQLKSGAGSNKPNLVYRRAKPGHLLGEVSFIDCEPHSATCAAETDLDVAVLERADMALMMQENTLAAAQLMAGLLRLMAKRIRNANENLDVLTQTSGVLRRAASQMADTSPAPLARQ
jgi:CRP/FNR family transcriptional regulator, cyclic AMP receptor protein